jgi:hypothetical protein
MKTPSDPTPVLDELVALLRAEGHAEAADRLHQAVHATAYTTGSEMMGELLLTLKKIRRDCKSGLTSEARSKLGEGFRALGSTRFGFP